MKKEINPDDLDSVLDGISDIVRYYHSEKVIAGQTLNKAHRKLSSLLYFLNEHRIRHKDEWEEAFHKCSEQTAAKKIRFADFTVPELYYCRKIYEAGKEVLMSISIQLKYD